MRQDENPALIPGVKTLSPNLSVSRVQVKKLKYHQYIPPDQKADKERPPQMDSSYAKLLHQQQLFLQLQILNQQQQHYNYHTILPAPPKWVSSMTACACVWLQWFYEKLTSLPPSLFLFTLNSSNYP